MKRCAALFLFVVALSSFVVGQVPSPPALTKKEAPPATEAPKNVHEMTAVDVEAFLDGLVPLQLKHSGYRGRDNLRCEGRQTAFCERLRLCGRSEETACLSARYPFSSRFNFQTLYLDRCHAIV